MNFFLVILFVCTTDGCTFMQSKQKYFKEGECVVAANAATKQLKDNGYTVQATCIQITDRDMT